MLRKNKLSLLCFVVLLFSLTSFSQDDKETKKVEKPKSFQVDELSNALKPDARSARIDGLLSAILQNETNTGVIMFYCGKVCHYGEFEAHVRGIRLKLKFIGYPLEKIHMMFGGYTSQATDDNFGLFRKDACLPVPKSD